MQEEKKTGVFVIDYLIKEKIIQQEESKKLAYMLSSNEQEMRTLAHFIIAEKWKLQYPLPVIFKSRILKTKINEQILEQEKRIKLEEESAKNKDKGLEDLHKYLCDNF